MISCRLMGGMSNQMWQIASIFALAKRNGVDFAIDPDSCFTPLQGHPSSKYADNLFRKIPRIHNRQFTRFYKEPSFTYSEIPFVDDTLYDGYWQSFKYLEGSEDETRDLFYFNHSHKDYLSKFFNLPAYHHVTSVHVRRGDYLNNSKIHPTCPKEYYQRAMDYIGDGLFIVVSDDIEWCKQNFRGSNIKYAEFNDEILDLTLLTMVDNSIIANSSFSFWGAYLSHKHHIIAPKVWFGPEGPQAKDICPPDWVRF
jgi:hypothetical protein